jgi:hypothetical protein
MLKWLHIAKSNAKRNFLGVYHKINGEYLQNYLDEFVYKLNRRYFKSIFERLVVASVYPYWQTSNQYFIHKIQFPRFATALLHLQPLYL